PKREYKKEGYDLFRTMMQSIKQAVVATAYRAQVRTEDVERLEEQRRRQVEARQRQMSAVHPGTEPWGAAVAARGGGGRGGAPGGRRGRGGGGGGGHPG
ncbi:MAG: hypothetical protein NZ898_06000, partial [Myxococcota bacterium]|nr:hypothetical protein [Myxococcota bacterium]